MNFLSIKSSSYPDFNRKTLYCINASLNNWSSLTLSEQFVRHHFATITGIFSAMYFGWQDLGDKYWCVSIFFEYILGTSRNRSSSSAL